MDVRETLINLLLTFHKSCTPPRCTLVSVFLHVEPNRKVLELTSWNGQSSIEPVQRRKAENSFTSKGKLFFLKLFWLDRTNLHSVFHRIFRKFGWSNPKCPFPCTSFPKRGFFPAKFCHLCQNNVHCVLIG